MINIMWVWCISNFLFECDCQRLNLDLEIANSENIIVGKVLNQNENQFTVRVEKVWKGRYTTSDSVHLVQFVDECDRYLLIKNEYHVLLFNENSISQCSRSSSYRRSKIVPTLDSIFQNKKLLNRINEKVIDSLEYNRKYVIETDLKLISKENKNILYYYKNRIISEEQIPTELNLFYPTRFYHISDRLRVGDIDFDHVLYISTAHQDMIWNDERKDKLIRKIKRKIGH